MGKGISEIKDKCRIWLYEEKNIPNSTNYFIPFDNQDFDTNEMWDDSDKTHIKIKTKGFYLLIGQIFMTEIPTEVLTELSIWKNDLGDNTLVHHIEYTTGITTRTMKVITIAELEKDDVVSLIISHNHTDDLVLSTSWENTFLVCVRLI